MFVSIFILAISSALLLFYVQTVCARALRHKFSHPYSEGILTALRLEYPVVREAFETNRSRDCWQALHSLKCDFVALEYLLKNSNGARCHVSRQEKILFLYFRLLLFCLPVHKAFKFGEKEAVSKLATILQYFANLAGERLDMDVLETVPASPKS